MMAYETQHFSNTGRMCSYRSSGQLAAGENASEANGHLFEKLRSPDVQSRIDNCTISNSFIWPKNVDFPILMTEKRSSVPWESARWLIAEKLGRQMHTVWKRLGHSLSALCCHQPDALPPCLSFSQLMIPLSVPFLPESAGIIAFWAYGLLLVVSRQSRLHKWLCLIRLNIPNRLEKS